MRFLNPLFKLKNLASLERGVTLALLLIFSFLSALLLWPTGIVFSVLIGAILMLLAAWCCLLSLSTQAHRLLPGLFGQGDPAKTRLLLSIFILILLTVLPLGWIFILLFGLLLGLPVLILTCGKSLNIKVRPVPSQFDHWEFHDPNRYNPHYAGSLSWRSRHHRESRHSF